MSKKLKANSRFCRAFSWILFISSLANIPGSVADELRVGKVCPVKYDGHQLGLMIVSDPWYHASRGYAAYQAMDDATGIGVEIHFFSNVAGDINHQNIAQCDRYRLLQTRATNALLFEGERSFQIDVPEFFDSPFYDDFPLEHGRGSHLTPPDDSDKPWQGRYGRASTVGLYDTPYVSDSYGIEGEDIRVEFETCAVCQRDHGYDSILSCVSWGYQRDYMGGQTGWSEPEPIPVQCHDSITSQTAHTIRTQHQVSYNYYLDWR